MSIGSVMAVAEAHHKNIVMGQTWGHLFPKWNEEPTIGVLRVASGIYGDLIVIDEEIDIEGSPWWSAAVYDFIEDLNLESDGSVYEVLIEVRITSDIKDLPCMLDLELEMENEKEDGTFPSEWLLDYMKPKFSQRIVITLVSIKYVLKPL